MNFTIVRCCSDFCKPAEAAPCDRLRFTDRVHGGPVAATTTMVDWWCSVTELQRSGRRNDDEVFANQPHPATPFTRGAIHSTLYQFSLSFSLISGSR